MLKPEAAHAKRERMLRDGYALIENILPEDFLADLRAETERLIAAHEEAPEFRFQGQHIKVAANENALIKKLLTWAPAYQALEAMGFGDFRPDRDRPAEVIILTKEPGGPPLYWHQDWMWWNDPLSMSPWPEFMSLSYYLTDTAVENGCLKVIPGSHLKRFPIHDQLVPAHEQGARFVADDDPIMFSDVPGQARVEVKAGDLALMDARILHAAGQNFTDRRRTLVLSWHRRPTGTIPEYWSGDVPKEIIERDPNAEYEGSRIPGAYLKP